MIFVTVGHQMPFDRLITAVDQWAAARDRDDVFAQIGDASYTPEHIAWARTLCPAEFRDRVEQAVVIVAHAGTGTILTAMELCKPILVMPRRAALMETRNDHQIATAQRFMEMGRVGVAMDEQELPEKLDQISNLKSSGGIASTASPDLLRALSTFIHLTDE